MDDELRELLTLAARAGGIEIVRWDDQGPIGNFDMLRPWNPWINHDQAKNLRHRCRLCTGFDDRFPSLGACAYATYSTDGGDTCNSIFVNIEEAGGRNAATRQAIVRAAAATMAQLSARAYSKEAT